MYRWENITKQLIRAVPFSSVWGRKQVKLQVVEDKPNVKDSEKNNYHPWVHQLVQNQCSLDQWLEIDVEMMRVQNYFHHFEQLES